MTFPDPPRRPLAVTIVPGMRIVDMAAELSGTIVGITQAFCIYRLADSETLSVASWRNVALANVCPAEPLLPADVTQNDRRNAQARLLGELLQLRPFGLTAVQTAAYDELVAALCPSGD